MLAFFGAFSSSSIDRQRQAFLGVGLGFLVGCVDQRLGLGSLKMMRCLNPRG